MQIMEISVTRKRSRGIGVDKPKKTWEGVEVVATVKAALAAGENWMTRYKELQNELTELVEDSVTKNGLIRWVKSWTSKSQDQSK